MLVMINHKVYTEYMYTVHKGRFHTETYEGLTKQATNTASLLLLSRLSRHNCINRGTP